LFAGKKKKAGGELCSRENNPDRGLNFAGIGSQSARAVGSGLERKNHPSTGILETGSVVGRGRERGGARAGKTPLFRISVKGRPKEIGGREKTPLSTPVFAKNKNKKKRSRKKKKKAKAGSKQMIEKRDLRNLRERKRKSLKAC